jgi:phi13 family phage major tail protein
MPTAENKVRYGIKNVYYALLTENNGAVTYGTPVRFPGARSMSLTASGDEVKWPADDTVYFQSFTNGGYSGTLVMARIIDSFREDVLSEQEDTNGVLSEYSDQLTKPFALLFEFEGDASHTRHVLYNCKVSRPDINAQTIGGDDPIEPQEETLNLTVLPRVDNALVQARCTEGAAAYDNWFTAVYTG